MPPQRVIIRPNAQGILVDRDGNKYNDAGDRIDDDGHVIPEPQEKPVEQPINNGDAGADANQIQTLADYNRPDLFYANRSAIRPPTFEREDFVIKLQYYTHLEQSPFRGLPSEYPMDHLEKFERIAGGIKADGVNRDYIFLQLFPHSLAGDAWSWLNSLPAGSLTTWDATRRAFLLYFCDDSKSEELRSMISSFKQGPREAFKAAWNRFKKYQRDCPHHGFTELQLLSTFFRGIDWRYQVSMDSASNGNFMTRSVDSAKELIHNLTQSSSTKSIDQERARSGGAGDDDISELKDSVATIMSLLKNQSVKQGQSSECNQVRHVDSIQQPNELRDMMKQLLDGQTNLKAEIDGLKFSNDELRVHVKNLDIKVAQVTEAMGRSGNNQRNCSAIMVKNVEVRRGEEDDSELSEASVGRHHHPVSNDTPSCGKSDLVSEAGVDRHHHPVSNDTEPRKEETLQNEGKSQSKVYTTPLPYPKAPRKSKKEAEDTRCKEILAQLSTRIPFFDACKMAPILGKYVKKMLANTMSLDEGVMMITETCSRMISKRMPKKLKDPGSFVLNCKIGSLTFERSLCDLGSSVNLMPLSVAKKLGMAEFFPTSIVLVLADRTVRTPKGILEDVPVKIGDCWIPADFIVLDFDHHEPTDSLILGRPFLATAGALIDCRDGTIELRLDDKTILFEMDRGLKRPTIDGQSFMVEIIEEVADKVDEKLEIGLMVEKVCDHGEEKQKKQDQPELTKKSAEPVTAVKQKAPDIQPPPSKPRYVLSKPSLSFAGKHSFPPRRQAHPGVILAFLGRPHAPTAYSPPWIRRFSTQPFSKGLRPP